MIYFLWALIPFGLTVANWIPVFRKSEYDYDLRPFLHGLWAMFVTLFVWMVYFAVVAIIK